MDLSPHTRTFVDDARDWQGSGHGTPPRTITLDGSTFTTTWADGNVPSGVALALLASGLYAPVGLSQRHR